MKRLLLIISAILSLATLQAQTPYLETGDIVTIHVGYWEQTAWWPETVYEYRTKYMEASTSGIKMVPYATDNCLWELTVENNAYAFKDLTTGKHLRIKDVISQESALILADNASAFYFTDKGSQTGEYMYGQLYYNTVTPWGSPISLLMSQYDDIFMVAGWNPSDLYIEKWEKKGNDNPTGHFSPSKIEFSYIGDQEGENEKDDDPHPVTFMIEATTESYYQCIRRQDEALLRRTTNNVAGEDVEIVDIYWESDSINRQTSPNDLESNLNITADKYIDCPETDGRAILSLSQSTGGQDGKWQFTITPEGASPMGLKQKIYEETVNGTTVGIDRWVDYADRVVVEYQYGESEPQKAYMRVVRKSYREEELPTLTFSINPLTYTFTPKQESKVFTVVATHQHGKAIYNVDNQIIDTTFTVRPEKIDLTNENLKLTSDKEWLTAEIYNNSEDKIIVTAANNESGAKRYATLTGRLSPQQSGDHVPVDFTIPLEQRAVQIEGGIKFYTQAGEGATDAEKEKWNSEEDQQKVHTVEKTIYYLPNQAEIELRLQESGYSGYMRWYDYETGGDPYYNYTHEGKQATSWVRSPRGNQDKAFSAINTPKDGESETIAKEGHSHGLYSLNKADGGALDEDNPYNNNPIIKGWEDGAAHTMACDVSAYTDYTIEKDNHGQITSITEPTLSYRQIFHLKPAQEMADMLKEKSERDEYLENYKYQAPAGKQILLATQYRYKKARSHSSEMCYFFKDNWGILRSIHSDVPVQWYVQTKDKNGNWSEEEPYDATYSAEMDYLIVRNETYPATKRYSLKLPNSSKYLHTDYTTDLLIARFEVEFVDIETQGPTNKTIITQQRINSQFKKLTEINFDNTTTHLPWEQASYGYVYETAPLKEQYKRGASQGCFPFYGEYTVLESVNKDWAKGAAHGGTGKALYVDGTMEPGLVASITAKAKICSGQTMYCSAWFCNPTPSGWTGEGNPIFRCNIQGKNKNEEEWHDAGVYFVGELLKGSGWQQIVFPIQSASSYDSTRVSIYNFATTNQGNDFMVDDITLFVSQLPIAAYKGEMACRSIEGGTTTAAAVLRLDYSNINAGSDGYMYYQIYNESYENKENGEVVSKGAAVNLTGENAAYYHDYDVDHGIDHEHPYGSIHIPQKDFDPDVHNSTASKENKVLIYTSVSAFLDDLVLEGKKNGKAYIRTQQSGVTKWLLYVVHLVESTTQKEINEEQDQEKRKQIPLQKLFDEHQYVMRMAYTPEELPTAECNLTTPLYATQETLFRLRNSDKKTISHTEIGEANNEGEEMYIHTKSTNNCPNDLYFLTSTVINHLAVDGAGGNTDNIAAPIFSDWLIGDPQGDVLSEKAPSRSDYNTDNEYQTDLTNYNTRLQAAVAGFKKMYGYTHDEVTSAIMYDMRRHSTDDPNSRDYNPNYYAKTFEELQSRRFLSQENYEIVKHLHDNGWLQLCDTTVHFYLGTRLDKEGKTIGDTVRYWCFPIAETAKTKVDTDKDGTPEREITLKDCNEPHRVTVSIAKGSYYMNITPIEYAKKTPQQHVQLPTLKVLEGSNEITIPITQSGNTKIADANLETRQITLSLDDPNLTYFNLETGEPYQEKPTLEVGNEYTIRLTLKESNGWEYPEDNSSNCRVGYVFATIQIVPNTLVWHPTEASFNGWGKDENWKGWVDKDKDNVIDKTDNPTTNELCEGYVPISGADVIIPKLDNTLLYPYIVPEHTHNHYPMTVGFQPHHCNNIYFAPGAKLYNQHLLEYDTAFVDMQFPAAKWHLVSAPLQGMVSGDMFVPHYGWYDEEQDMRVAEPNPFEVSEFKGIRHADAAYAFWEAFYNTNVDGSNTLLRDFDNIQFTQSNTLAQELKAGHGYAVYGLGWKDTAMLTVRLPKPDKSYAYFADGKETGNSISIPQENRGRLAYTDDHDQQGMTITLTNNTASEYFLFGNPTMAFVDMHALYLDNQSQWSGVFKTIQGDVINATTPSTMTTANRYLPPMTSALLKVNDEATEEQKKSMVITLLPSHLTLNNAINPIDEVQEGGNDTQQAPARRIAGIDERPVNHEAVQSELMTIYAFTPKGIARTVLATNPAANDYYTSGEDALFTSTGVENESYVTTPLNMYTVAEQVPMMADVRQGISEIPLGILAADKARSEYMQVAFYLTSNWSRECYFVDHKTGQKIRIMDGLVISVEMPENHEQRYSIEGPDSYQGSDGVTTSTTQPSVSTTGNKVWAYAPDRSTVVVSSSDLIKSATLYDITGRLVASSPLNSHLMTNTLTLHTAGVAGVYIVDVTLRDGSTERAQVIVL